MNTPDYRQRAGRAATAQAAGATGRHGGSDPALSRPIATPALDTSTAIAASLSPHRGSIDGVVDGR